MKTGIITRLLSAFVFLWPTGPARPAPPVRQYDAHATITKVIAATAAEKEAGVLVTIVLKGREQPIRVTKETGLQRQKGKLVSPAGSGDLEVGQRVSVWLSGKSDRAEAVLIFP